MKWKNRLTNYNFWISIVSAVLLILQAFDINFDIAYINEIATAVLGLLVVIGIISDPTKSITSTPSSTVNTLNANAENIDNITPSETDSISFNEEKVKEQISQTENQIIPIDDKNADNNADIQNDFKVLIAQIQHDLEAMTKENLALYNNLKNTITTTTNQTETQIQDTTLDKTSIQDATLVEISTQSQTDLSENSIEPNVIENEPIQTDTILEPVKTSYSIVN